MENQPFPIVTSHKKGSSPIVHEDGMSFSMSGQFGRCLQSLSLAQGWSTCRGFPFPFAGVDCASTMTTIKGPKIDPSPNRSLDHVC